jgi:phosphate transport system protein
MAPGKHTLQLFDEDLARLRALVLELGRRTVAHTAGGIDSLVRADRELAREIVERDGEMNAMQHQVDALVTIVLARQQAMAQDLREILAAGRIATHLERCADYAKGTARRGAELRLPLAAAVVAELSWMRARLVAMLEAVLAAYAERDAEKASIAWASDDDLDEMYRQLLAVVLLRMREDPACIDDGAQLLLVAKGLERIGDHATDVAEEVHLMVTGSRFDRARHRSPPGDREP